MADYVEVLKNEKGGFNFENHTRNMDLISKGMVDANALYKSGTTVVGVQCEDAVVLAADTRATMGNLICTQECMKIFKVSDTIYYCGAGCLADIVHCCSGIRVNIELLRMQTGTKPRVKSVETKVRKLLFSYQGHIQTSMILGGVDVTGPHLFQIHSHGSSSKRPFCTMGSGSFAALSALEDGYKKGMTVNEGMALACRGIVAGIWNDLGSGGSVNLVVMTKDGAQVHRNFEIPQVALTHVPRPVKFPVGTTPVLSEEIKKRIVITDES